MKPIQSDRGAVFSAFLGTSVSSALVTALTFLSGVLIARTLGPEGRADYGMLLLVAQTAASIGCLSFFDAAVVHIQRRVGNAIDVLPTMVASALIITVFATGVTVLAVYVFQIRLPGVSHGFLLAICFLIIATLLLIQCFSAVERSGLNFHMINVERVGSPAVFSLLIASTWQYFGTSLTAAFAVCLFVSSKFPAIFAWLYRYRMNIVGPLVKDFAKKTLRTGLNLHVAVALGAIASQLDRFFAAASWPKDLLGYYFVAFSAIGAGYSVVTTALNTVLLPYLAGLEAVNRSNKISQIIRLTFILTSVTILFGWLIIPYALPLLYGIAYVQAVDMALWLLLALAVLPLKAIVLETGRSLGKGRPSVEMALVSFGTMLLGYYLTGFSTPIMLILFFGLSNILSTISGMRHMLTDGDIRLSLALLPGVDDLRFLMRILIKMTKGGAK